MGLFVLNGRCLTDSEGEYTYISSTGKSIIDYFITEPEIYDLFTQFYVSDMDIGDHLPVIGYIGEKGIDPKICICKNVHKLEWVTVNSYPCQLAPCQLIPMSTRTHVNSYHQQMSTSTTSDVNSYHK